MMNLKERVDLLVVLGNQLKEENEYLDAIIHRTYHNNLWFTEENCKLSINHIANSFLSKDALDKWTAKYFIDDQIASKRIAILFSDKIPVENFHDFLSVFVQGHKAIIRLSEKDKYLFPYLIKLMQGIDERVKQFVEIVDKLPDFDAIIMDGKVGNNDHLKKYFKAYPHIIRNRRNSIALLNQAESSNQLEGLADDIFSFFGRGIRNISKIYIPENFDFNPLMECLHERKKIILNSKYKNNFDYIYSIYLLNKEKIVANGCIILTENKELLSRVAGLHYEYYVDELDLQNKLNASLNNIQSITSGFMVAGIDKLEHGKSTLPSLEDYPDKIDTMNFLLSLA